MKTRSKWELRLELERNAAHLFFGLAIAGFVGIAPKYVGTLKTLALLGVVIAAGAAMSLAVQKRVRIPLVSGFVERLERKKAWPGKGAIALFTGVFLAIALFDKRPAFVGALSVALCDSFSTIFGKSWGRHRIVGKKTIEGFVGGFVPTLVVLLAFMSAPLALLVALTASVAELLSPMDDNLVIPILAGAVFTAFRYSFV
ncbi:phosphatidate cytidylyltransferase [Candidatus Micrarchaeota archaeon]|nr:phosphatidate cytidylyltransferase [Candidatus Micrarchaeota archaeon]